MSPNKHIIKYFFGPLLMFFNYKMNYDDKKHVIEYIEGNKVKEFKVPEKDYNLKFNKMSYNDVIMYIKLTKEEEKKNNEAKPLKYKPLKTVATKTKDYFAQDIKLMSQAEKLKKIAEFLVSNNIKELKEFLSNSVFNDDPIIKSVMSLLNQKGYTYNEINDLLERKKEIDLYSNEIENCIEKVGKTNYSFKNVTFKNTLGDLLDLSKQINILNDYTIFVPVDNSLNYEFASNPKSAFQKLKKLIFGELKFSNKEAVDTVSFLQDYVIPSLYLNKYLEYYLVDTNEFELTDPRIPFYFYCNENKKIYLNIKILYYLIQFNPIFQNNNYKFVVEKLKNGVINNVIFIAGSAFDLDNIINSLDPKINDKSKDYYDEYVKLMSETITKFFDKQFTPIIYRLEEAKGPDSKGSQAKGPDSKGIQIEPVNLTFTDEDQTDDESIKEGEGVFSFRRDTKETLQLLLNRIIKLESTVETQNEKIKELKLGIKSINQSLPDDKRKEIFGNYFSNSIRDQENGSLNPDKVYPKITFSEFRKLYNKMDSKDL